MISKPLFSPLPMPTEIVILRKHPFHQYRAALTIFDIFAFCLP
jgi:hypothetical protein